MKLWPLLLILLLSGCSERRESAPSLDNKAAMDSAKAVALLTRGRICSVEPTGSMIPTFDDRALIVMEPVQLADVRTGDIVVRASGGLLIVHRVVSISGGQLITQGDANSAADPGYVGAENLRGRVVAIIYGR